MHPNTTHGHTVGGVISPTYHSWRDMRGRCGKSDHPKYPEYGGRGIKICYRWRKFENFLADMGERPKGLTLDRINNDGHYSPVNCRWASQKQQNTNTRRVKLITVGGITDSQRGWSGRLGYNKNWLHDMIKNGHDPEALIRAHLQS